MENSIIKLVIEYGITIILGITALILGHNIIKHLIKAISKKFISSKVDISLQSFLKSIIKTALYILLVLAVLSIFGFQSTSLIAILASASFAVGLALQGSLSNFAGGIIILLLKPFKVGDYIEAAGHSGSVVEIQIFYTILNTPDNKKVIIPNSNLSNSSTINYSANSTRRVDFTVCSGYDDNIEDVKSILDKIASQHPLILKDPAYQIVLGQHGASSLDYYLRVWCKTEDYWTIYFEVMEKIKNEFDQNKISIPYPQMDVHYKNEEKVVS